MVENKTGDKNFPVYSQSCTMTVILCSNSIATIYIHEYYSSPFSNWVTQSLPHLNYFDYSSQYMHRWYYMFMYQYGFTFYLQEMFS